MLIIIIGWVLQSLLVLLAVAFFTLFERKVIGLFHLRLGPNKVGGLGLLQPLLDAFKLLSKQNIVNYHSNRFSFHLSPHISLGISIILWLVAPFSYSYNYTSISFVLFLCVRSSLVFGSLYRGWSSNSKYSLLGSLRSVAQSISYEAVITTLSVAIIIYLYSYDFLRISLSASLFIILFLPVWIFRVLAETHRAPFDFAERESELVSGYNTEYSAGYFAFIFLSEYIVLILSCLIISVIFLGWLVGYSVFLLGGFSMVFLYLFIWIRITFRRFRYDLLIISAWKSYLPFSLGIFIVVCLFL